jgi:metal-responsive CopG/Arc/MetJ family transcriptional regulator
MLISLTIKDALISAIDKQAARENRSRANLIETVMIEYLKNKNEGVENE